MEQPCNHTNIALEDRSDAGVRSYELITLVAACQECDFEREATDDERSDFADAAHERSMRAWHSA